MGCNCGKPKCDGKCGISPAVLQINNPSECVIFHKVDVPASMGDSTTNPPKTGAYKNVLLYYEADQTSWLYSSDGIPVRLTNGITNYEDAINLPQINGETLIGDKSSADLKLADAPMVITIASGNIIWSGADTAEDIYNFFLNQGKVNVVFEGSENYGYEIVSAAYIPGEQKMMCMVAVASIDPGSSPVDFAGNALYGLMTFYTAGKAVDVGEIDLQPRLFVADFTGLNIIDGNVLEGVPATSFSIGMVKPGDGLEVASDGTLSAKVGDGLEIDSDGALSVNVEVTHTFDTVADMKASTVLKADDVAQTLGYHVLNDGGGALYYITDTAESNEIQEELGDGLYATLTNVHTEGYIDLRWLGADSTGVTGCADIVESALLYSNNHYLKPIKVVGKFYIEKAISLVGSIAMFGMNVPGTERFFYAQETSSYTLEPVSQFILNNNITAINLTGIGSSTLNASVLNIKSIDITEKSNSKTSTFIDVNAFGGPGRPNVIKEVSAHGINTLLSAVHILTDTYTNLMLLDIGNINCYGCGTVLNFPTLSNNNEGLMNLNLHDSVIEQSTNIVLESLGCYNQIKSNLFEALTGATSIKVKKAASLDFIGNYFELNAGDIVFDTYAAYSDSEVTDMPFIRFENNTIMTVSNNFIFKNCAVSYNAYNTNNMIFYNSVVKLDSINYSYIRTRLNSLISSKTNSDFNHIRFKDTIYTTDNTQELSDEKYVYDSSFATDKYIINGVTTWKLAGNAGGTLSNDYISVQANDYVGLLFYKSSNGNSSSLQISLVDGGGSGRSHIPSKTSPYDGYYLYITKVDTTTALNVYVKNRRDNDVYISPIKLINFGQDLTTDVMQYLTLYK